MYDWRRLLKFRCTGCGNCCRGTVVMVGDDDIRRLAAGTGRDPRSFIRFVGKDSITLDKRSPWWLRLRRRRFVLALQHRHRACIFLGEDNLCTVYEHRPLACREHPFHLQHTESGALWRMSMSRVVHCPHAWDGDLKRRDLVALSRWTARESEAYTEKVRLWNRRRPRAATRLAFLRYLGLVDDRDQAQDSKREGDRAAVANR